MPGLEEHRRATVREAIDQEKYDDMFSDDFTKSELTNVRDEVVDFCEQQLHNRQPRDDYRELLKLMQDFWEVQQQRA